MARSAPEVELVELCTEDGCEAELKEKRRMGIQREQDEVVKGGTVAVCKDGHLNVEVVRGDEMWPAVKRVE
jgi:hypothetical protein